MAIKSKKNSTKKAIKSNKIAAPHIQWRRKGREIFVTNDFGYHIRLDEKDFNKWLEGKLDEKSRIYNQLFERGFIREQLNFEDLASKWKKQNSFMFAGTGLHIFVLTLRCNEKCLYCQSGAVGGKTSGMDMTWETAKKCVDIAFQTPRNSFSIEFQGGEPLCNWDVLKKTVEYARKKEKETGKKLNLALVSNFSLMDEKKANFLIGNEVSICTSIDGPKSLHNKNRIGSGGDTYDIAAKWIRYFNKKHDTQGPGPRIFKPSALLTVSKYSLSYPKEIVDEYLKLGLETIFVRPLSPIGYAKKLWDQIGYKPQDFLAFYEKILKYILELNRKGKNIKERTAQMLCQKIFEFEDAGFLDLRWPCGAAIGQLAYNYDGSIYTCDEGRMVGWEGDDFFKVGDVDVPYRELITNSHSRGCAISSTLENQPRCMRCAYRPYCGVCPVINYETQNSLWGNNISNYKCAISMGIFDILFDILKKNENEKILRKWIIK